MVNANLLKSEMVKNGYNQKKLSEALKISENSLSNKITGKAKFNLDEVEEICKVLQIENAETKIAIFLAE